MRLIKGRPRKAEVLRGLRVRRDDVAIGDVIYLEGHEAINPEGFSLCVKCTPNKTADVDIDQQIFDGALGAQTHIRKMPNSGGNALRLRVSNTLIADVPEAVYSHIWVPGQEIIFFITHTSQPAVATSLWALSGGNIVNLLNAVTTPIAGYARTDEFKIGQIAGGTVRQFEGTVDYFEFWKQPLGEQEVFDLMRGDTWNYNRTGQSQVVNLPLGEREIITDPDFNLAQDGDMEAADTSAWTAGNSAVLSKVSLDRKNKLLQVRYGGVADPYASQNVLELGKLYFVRFRVRTDQVHRPQLRDDSTVHWTGSLSQNQQVSGTFTAGAAGALRLQVLTSEEGYAQFDDLEIFEVNNATEDVSGFNNNGKILGATKIDNDRGYEFSDGTISVPELNAPVSGFTMEVLFETFDPSISQYVYIADNAQTSLLYTGFYIFSGGLRAYVTDGVGTNVIIYTNLTKGRLHAIMTYDSESKQLSLVLNGRLFQSIQATGVGDVSIKSLRWGDSPDTALDKFQGRIYLTKLYKKPLTQLQCLDLYDQSWRGQNETTPGFGERQFGEHPFGE